MSIWYMLKLKSQIEKHTYTKSQIKTWNKVQIYSNENLDLLENILNIFELYSK